MTDSPPGNMAAARISAADVASVRAALEDPTHRPNGQAARAGLCAAFFLIRPKEYFDFDGSAQTSQLLDRVIEDFDCSRRVARRILAALRQLGWCVSTGRGRNATTIFWGSTQIEAMLDDLANRRLRA